MAAAMNDSPTNGLKLITRMIPTKSPTICAHQATSLADPLLVNIVFDNRIHTHIPSTNQAGTSMKNHQKSVLIGPLGCKVKKAPIIPEIAPLGPIIGISELVSAKL